MIVEIGTVCSGTMKCEDLIPTFTELLRTLDTDKSFTSVIEECDRIIKSAETDESIWEDENTCIVLNEDLWEALDCFSPELCFFGAHPGNGSDYGYWPSEDIENGFDGLRVSDLSEVPEDYKGDHVLLINDHGNTTLYKTVMTLKEVWSVV